MSFKHTLKSKAALPNKMQTTNVNHIGKVVFPNAHLKKMRWVNYFSPIEANYITDTSKYKIFIFFVSLGKLVCYILKTHPNLDQPHINCSIAMCSYHTGQHRSREYTNTVSANGTKPLSFLHYMNCSNNHLYSEGKKEHCEKCFLIFL